VGQFIEPHTEQARLTADYVERYKTGLGAEPPVHWLPEFGNCVCVPPGLVPEVEDYDLSHEATQRLSWMSRGFQAPLLLVLKPGHHFSSSISPKNCNFLFSGVPSPNKGWSGSILDMVPGLCSTAPRSILRGGSALCAECAGIPSHTSQSKTSGHGAMW
jgi:hypothetical protein